MRQEDIVTAQIDALASRKRRNRDLLAAENRYPPASSRRIALSKFAAAMTMVTLSRPYSRAGTTRWLVVKHPPSRSRP